MITDWMILHCENMRFLLWKIFVTVDKRDANIAENAKNKEWNKHNYIKEKLEWLKIDT